MQGNPYSGIEYLDPKYLCPDTNITLLAEVVPELYVSPDSLFGGHFEFGAVSEIFLIFESSKKKLTFLLHGSECQVTMVTGPSKSEW